MSASGKSIAAVVSIGAGETVANLIKDKPGVVLDLPSKVDIFLTRSAVGVDFTVTIGATNVYPSGPANISTVAGSLPSVRDDKVITVFAQKSDEILILAINTTASVKEARVLVKTMPVDDQMLLAVMNMRR